MNIWTTIDKFLLLFKKVLRFVVKIRAQRLTPAKLLIIGASSKPKSPSLGFLYLVGSLDLKVKRRERVFMDREEEILRKLEYALRSLSLDQDDAGSAFRWDRLRVDFVGVILKSWELIRTTIRTTSCMQDWHATFSCLNKDNQQPKIDQLESFLDTLTSMARISQSKED